MKKILSKIDNFLIKLFISAYKKEAKKLSATILKRGADEYKEFTPEFILQSIQKTVKRTPLLVRPAAPDLYFKLTYDSMLVKFPIISSQFDKLGRNDRIRVALKHNKARVIIKKKEFNKDIHQYLGVLVMPV